MTRKRKPPSPPAPPDFEAGWGSIPTEDPAERERLRGIVERNGRQIADPHAFDLEVGSICREATWALYERLRGDPGAVAAILEDLQQRMASDRERLCTLGPDVEERLDAGMTLDARDPPPGSFSWRLLEGPLAPRLEDRLAWAAQLLGDLARWSQLGGVGLPKPPRGRPADAIARRLVARVGDAWVRQTGCPPTVIYDPIEERIRGDFVELCTAIITPIWRDRGLRLPSVERFTKAYRRAQVRDENSRKSDEFRP